MEQEKRFSVRFPLGVLEAIKQLAKEDNRSINSEIIWILRTYIAARQRKETHATDDQDQA